VLAGAADDQRFFWHKRDGRIVGGASAEVDTTGYGIAFRQHAFGALLGDDDDSVTVRARSSYTPTLTFGGFRIDVERGGELVVLSGQRTEDSLLALATEGLGERSGRTVSAPDPLFLPASAALPVVLLNRPRPGARTQVTVFDPLSQRTRIIPLTVARESVLVVVDSAGFDPESRRWQPARSDTLRSWLITSDSTRVSAWVDRSGAIVQLDDGRGTRAIRTAYEIAFENWRLERARSGRAR
jgi:hypothetical protein